MDQPLVAGFQRALHPDFPLLKFITCQYGKSLLEYFPTWKVAEKKMSNNGQQITANEAQASLDALESARNAAILPLRPPLWLNVVSALLLGVLTASYSLRSASDPWALAMYVSVFGFIYTYVYWLRKSRSLGTTAKLIPRGVASKAFYAAQAVVYLFVIIGSKALYVDGMSWVPYLAAAINGVFFSVMLHNYPTTEWGQRMVSK